MNFPKKKTWEDGVWLRAKMFITIINLVFVGGWVDNEEISNNGYAWADYPDDFSKNTNEWKSIYLGDDEPTNGMYLLCLYKKQLFYKCVYQYYDPKKSVFEPSVEVMAWCKINPPEVRR